MARSYCHGSQLMPSATARLEGRPHANAARGGPLDPLEKHSNLLQTFRAPAISERSSPNPGPNPNPNPDQAPPDAALRARIERLGRPPLRSHHWLVDSISWGEMRDLDADPRYTVY